MVRYTTGELLRFQNEKYEVPKKLEEILKNIEGITYELGKGEKTDETEWKIQRRDRDNKNRNNRDNRNRNNRDRDRDRNINKSEKRKIIAQAKTDIEELKKTCVYILNKLSKDNYEKLSKELLAIKTNDEEELKIIVGEIFKKVCIEQFFVKNYSKLTKDFCNKNPSCYSIIKQLCFDFFTNRIDNTEVSDKKSYVSNLVFMVHLYQENIFEKSEISNIIQSLLLSQSILDKELLSSILQIPNLDLIDSSIISEITILSKDRSLPSRIRFSLLDTLDVINGKRATCIYR